MSNLVVISFDNAEEAGKVRETPRSAQRSDYLSLDDSAVIVKDEEGKIHVKNEMDRGVKVGAIGGGLLGLLLAGIFFPVGGLLVGAALGGLIGKSVDLGIDQKFVKEVAETWSQTPRPSFSSSARRIPTLPWQHSSPIRARSATPLSHPRPRMSCAAS